jgi:hypothetical protein
MVVLLRELLEDSEPLLHNLDLPRVTNEALLVLNENLVVAGTIEVVGAKEVVEPVHGLEATPIAERVIITTCYWDERRPYVPC